MRRLLFVVLLILLLSTRSFCADNALADPVLKKPITLTMKGEALADVMKEIAKQTGLNVTVSRSISDQKATILVDDKPARDVMQGVATIFGYNWRHGKLRGKDTYELYQDAAVRKKRADAVQEARDKTKNEAMEKFTSKVKRLCEHASKSEDELKEVKERLEPFRFE
jgi:type II secretory pathway component GspD/PulD (secretin)